MNRLHDCPHCGREKVKFSHGRGWCVSCGSVSIPEPQQKKGPILQIVRDEDEMEKRDKIA